LDVDHFKNFNDTYGHVRGDECLQKVAAVIHDSISRPPDIAARYGGEEFICLLPETNHNGALQVAENIRLGVIQLGIPHVKSMAGDVVTISIGVVTAQCFKDGLITDLIVKADQQLYKAKSQGRNRVEAIWLGPGSAS
jgi:diguanylate cyclase (GGDEF)-like protein